MTRPLEKPASRTSKGVLPASLGPLERHSNPDVARAGFALIAMLDRVRNRVRSLAPTTPVRVVLQSRRMSCLYFMLLRGNEVDPLVGDSIADAQLLVDQFLDADAMAFLGVTLLVDDSLILGSTMVTEMADLRERGSSSIEVFVPCIDTERCNPQFVDYLGIPAQGADAPLPLTQKSIQDYSEMLAEALFRSTTPYFTDFPTCRLSVVQPGAIAALLTNPRWMVVDTTPALLAGDGQRVYSFVPTAQTDSRFRRRGVAAAVTELAVAKVRMFVSTVDDGTSEAVIVPLAIPGSLLPASLRAILQQVTDWLGMPPAAGSDEQVSWSAWADWSPVAQHRLLQMHLSSCLLAEFWTDLQASGAVSGEPLDRSRLEQPLLAAYFADKLESALAGFDATVNSYRSKSPRRVATPARPVPADGPLGSVERILARIDRERLIAPGPPARPKPGRVITLDPFWVKSVLDAFGYVGSQLEQPQQANFRSMTIDEFLNRRPGRWVSRGISISDFSRWSLPSVIDPDDPWTRSLISLAIDVGNDTGAAVPFTTMRATLTTTGAVSRLFRCGENSSSVASDLLELARARADGRDPAEALDPYLRAELSSGATDAEFRNHLNRSLDDVAKRWGNRPGTRIMSRWEGEIVEVSGQTATVSATSVYTNDRQNVVFDRESLASWTGLHHVKNGALVEWLVLDETASNGPSLFFTKRPSRH